MYISEEEEANVSQLTPVPTKPLFLSLVMCYLRFITAWWHRRFETGYLLRVIIDGFRWRCLTVHGLFPGERITNYSSFETKELPEASPSELNNITAFSGGTLQISVWGYIRSSVTQQHQTYWQNLFQDINSFLFPLDIVKFNETVFEILLVKNFLHRLFPVS